MHDLDMPFNGTGTVCVVEDTTGEGLPTFQVNIKRFEKVAHQNNAKCTMAPDATNARAAAASKQ